MINLKNAQLFENRRWKFPTKLINLSATIFAVCLPERSWFRVNAIDKQMKFLIFEFGFFAYIRVRISLHSPRGILWIFYLDWPKKARKQEINWNTATSFLIKNKDVRIRQMLPLCVCGLHKTAFKANVSTFKI